MDVRVDEPLSFWLQGTNVASGKARGIVIGTGLNTEIGKSTVVLNNTCPPETNFIANC